MRLDVTPRVRPLPVGPVRLVFATEPACCAIGPPPALPPGTDNRVPPVDDDAVLVEVLEVPHAAAAPKANAASEAAQVRLIGPPRDTRRSELGPQPPSSTATVSSRP